MSFYSENGDIKRNCQCGWEGRGVSKNQSCSELSETHSGLGTFLPDEIWKVGFFL